MTDNLSAIIIDDMDLARKSLAADLGNYCPEINILGEADSVVSGSKLIQKTNPDLIFLDIHLPDGEGFDILELLPDLKSKVIFTTGSDQHAIKAFQFSAVDYLLKPIDPELLIAAVNKLKSNVVRDELHVSLLKENINAPCKLSLHTAEQIKIADINDIVRLEAYGNYTQFYFLDGSKLLVTKTLKDYDTMLADNQFLRVHQSHLINLALLKSYIKTEGGYILMQDGTRVPVSVRKKPMVIGAIDAYAGR